MWSWSGEGGLAARKKASISTAWGRRIDPLGRARRAIVCIKRRRNMASKGSGVDRGNKSEKQGLGEGGYSQHLGARFLAAT